MELNGGERTRLSILEADALETDSRWLLVDHQVRIRALSPTSPVLARDPSGLRSFTTNICGLIESGNVIYHKLDKEYPDAEDDAFVRLVELRPGELLNYLDEDPETMVMTWASDVLKIVTNDVPTPAGLEKLLEVATCLAFVAPEAMMAVVRDRYLWERAQHNPHAAYVEALDAFALHKIPTAR